MAIPEFEAWREELLFTGRIVADSDDSIPPDEKERRCRRYVELVDMAHGVWEERVFEALVDSLQVDYDYEVYETTIGVITAFPSDSFGPWMVKALPGLIGRQPERAGDFLSLMVNYHRKATSPALVGHLAAFVRALTQAPDDIRREIRAFIAEQERQGWLRDKRGLFEHAEVA